MSDTATIQMGEANGAAKLSKKQKAKLQKKESRKHKQEVRKKLEEIRLAAEREVRHPQENSVTDTDIEIEYIESDPFANVSGEDDHMNDLKNVFDKFRGAQVQIVSGEGEVKQEGGPVAPAKVETKAPVKLSKRKRKMQRRLNIAVLKQLVRRPDLVEIWDTCAADPLSLIHLKSYRNAVPVPRHWSQRRRYLQGKRGLEKSAFTLPDYIAKTGIMDLRNASLGADSKLKTETRARVSGSGMGKLDIDYQILHDAFFKYQTKPKLTVFGDQYYEGKEYEVEVSEKRPGAYSNELREALGMTPGSPPPWLFNMQRLGLPPSYPNLRVPGVNAPIPPGAEWGFHAGGWGRPPMDQHGQPVYGPAVLGKPEPIDYAAPLDLYHWGEVGLELIEESSESSDEDVEMKEAEPAPTRKPYAPAEAEDVDMIISGMETPLSGLETPQNMEGTLRKRKKDESSEAKPLYEVLAEKESSVGAAFMGSTHQYVIKNSSITGGPEKVDLLKSQKTEAVDLALAPEELEKLTEDQLQKRFDAAMLEKQRQKQPLAAQLDDKKRKRGDDADSDPRALKKKKKEFKF